MKFINDFNSVPQKHLDKQLELSGEFSNPQTPQNGEFKEPAQKDYSKPYYIRDKHNPYLIHKYRD